MIACVRRLYSKVARELIWKLSGDARILASSPLFRGWGSRAPGSSGLARAWTTQGLKVLGTNAPMKCRGGGRRGDSGHEAAILLCFAVASYLSYLAR